MVITKEIYMPQLGESVTEGTINSWYVKEGEYVKKYEPIAEVLSDKVTAEIPSLFSGTISKIIAKEGESVPVGELICYIEVDSEQTKENAANPASEKQIHEDKPSHKQKTKKRRYSPAVLKLAQEHDLDLNAIDGTGKNGRITRKDVLRYLEQQKQIQKQTDEPVIPISEEKWTPQPKPTDIEIPLSGIRKAIAANTMRSVQEIPHGWMMVEADVTDLVAYREKIKHEFKEKEGFNLTYFSFFIKAVVEALKEYPQLNSMWAGDKIIQKKDINISIAVASGDVLFTPVIKNADEKSIKGIAKEVYELAKKARSGKLTREDVEGGTFTVNNTGVFGSVQSMGIINYPQAAILQIETIVKRPVVDKNGMIGPRDMVNLCLSLDHRVLDGLVCGLFLKSVKEKVENMNENTIRLY